MPSIWHESLLLLTRNRSTLTHPLISALGVKLQKHTVTRAASADLTSIQPAEYRADLVLHLIGRNGKVYRGVIIEVQRDIDPRKRFAWPAYVMNLRSQLQCPVSLLIITLDEAVARWTAGLLRARARPVDHVLRPYP